MSTIFAFQLPTGLVYQIQSAYIEFKLRIYQPSWEKSLIFKIHACQPPYVVGWIDIDSERQPGIIRLDHRK